MTRSASGTRRCRWARHRLLHGDGAVPRRAGGGWSAPSCWPPASSGPSCCPATPSPTTCSSSYLFSRPPGWPGSWAGPGTGFTCSEAEDRAAQAETEGDRQAALAAARERTRIARELHDVVAHHVSLMAVQAEAASLAAARSAGRRRAASVEIIGDTARQALVELRLLLGVLRGPGEQPLTRARRRRWPPWTTVLAQVPRRGPAGGPGHRGQPRPSWRRGWS